MSTNNNAPNGGRDNPSKPPAPRSMLASLISSQQRSAAQSRKHLVQRAMPFANLHKDGSSGNAAIQSFSAKEGPSYASSQAQKAVRGPSDGRDESAGPSKASSNGLPQKSQRKDSLSSPSLEHHNVRAPTKVRSPNKSVAFIAAGDTKFDSNLMNSSISKTKEPNRQMTSVKTNQSKAAPKSVSADKTNPSECLSKTDSRMGAESKSNLLKRKQGQTDKATQRHSISAAKSEANMTSLATELPRVKNADNLPKKKKKEFYPFRVKVGCVVAVRFRKLAEGGNSDIKPVIKEDRDSFVPMQSQSTEPDPVSLVEEPLKTDDETVSAIKSSSVVVKPLNDDQAQVQPTPRKVKPRKPKLFEVWTSPIPGEDSGMALLGRRVRCSFPKSYLTKWSKSHENTPEGLKRIVEGNVVSVLDDDCGYGTAVGLLVDRSVLKLRPYLQTLFDDAPDPTASSSEQKRRNLEALIRGKDKVAVKLVLSTVYESRRGFLEIGPVAQWVVAKHVLIKPSGLKPTKSERKDKGYTSQSLFVGDENDIYTQQEDNWRWNAGRLLQQTSYHRSDNNVGTIESHLFGEVVKMTVDSNLQDGSTSLATITFRRLMAPHQTKNGRMPHHKDMELFDVDDNDKSQIGLYFQAPVEHLVVIGRRVNRLSDSTNSQPTSDRGYTITHTYDSNENTYTPLSSFCESDSTHAEKTMLTLCQECRRLSNASKYSCDKCHKSWCQHCLKLIGLLDIGDQNNWIGPCCCNAQSTHTTHDVLSEPESTSTFSSIVASLQSTTPSDFTLPADLELVHNTPSYVPYSGGRKSKPLKQKRQKTFGGEKGPEKPRKKPKKLLAHGGVPNIPNEDYSVFKPTCSRLTAFDEVKKIQCYLTNNNASMCPEKFSSSNAPARKVVVRKVEEKSNASDRAARASQRRFVKSLTNLGDSVKGIDRLAGRDREEQLRFGRSLIHGWGVFATEPINAGDLIIEYRGELIGNAVADRRELEYEKAKVCDYQFRIDEHTVCDATKLGNVARYINASCSPNCYTQIITANENKRIVIYAKKNIQPGEELCYDYKFPLEYDPSKRIPCHCKSSNCQGFMNWDKKYVIIDNHDINYSNRK
ncbi:hypothetical protein ACHAXN_013034 [Cyclotella atomus]